MSPPDDVFLAIDAGGTHTHALVLTSDGTVLGVGRGGGGSPTHSDDAQTQVERAVDAALHEARVDPGGISLVGGGFAGINRLTGQDWARAWFAQVTAPRVLVNDALTAHTGAFPDGCGVIVIAGTGSTIVTLAEDGQPIDSGMFEHYAGGARHLVFDVVRRVLIGEGEVGDPIVPALLGHWQIGDIDGLRRALLLSHDRDRKDIKRRHGSFAPTVTQMADRSALADAALNWLCDLTAVGVRLLLPVAARSGRSPADRLVPVALIGALAQSEAYGDRLVRALGGRARIVTSRLGSLGGAAAFTLRTAGIALDEGGVARLQSGVHMAVQRLS